MLGENASPDLTDQARGLDHQLQELRTTAKPLTAGVAGLNGRDGPRHGLRVLAACDHYARALARSCSHPRPARIDPAQAGMLARAADRATGNIEALRDLDQAVVGLVRDLGATS